jgi:hypothetical protein
MNSPHPSGTASPARWSNGSSPKAALGVELTLLLGAGMAAALLHESFRWPLHMPGRHGLDWLAILMSARLLSARPGAALAVACGAALTALAAGSNVLRPLTYLLQGVVLDGLFLLLGRRSAMPLVAMAIGALVHAVSPLLKNLIGAQGLWSFDSLSQGLGYPLVAHALFGAIGAGCAALAVGAWRRSRQQPPEPR